MFSGRWSTKLRTNDKRFSFESLEDRRVMSATSPAGSPLALEPVVQTSPTLLTTEEWVHSLTYQSFYQLTPAQIVYLLPEQIATIPNSGTFGSISAESRAALNYTQVRALNVGNIRLSYLTPQQIGYLSTAQIQSLQGVDFPYLSPAQIPKLTPAQVSTLTSLSPLSVEARAAFTQPQVQAMNVAETRLHRLTPTQVSWLTAGQIQSLQAMDFGYLNPSQIPYLTPQQISTISSSGAFGDLSDAARAALTQPQVQALNVAVIGLNRLTIDQIRWLTTSQIQSLQLHDLIYLRPNQMQYISTAQMSSMTNWQTMASWSPEQRAAVLNYQIRALRPEAVRASLLTPLQINTLRVAQIQAVMALELHYLNPGQIKYLTNAQVAAIPSSSALGMWSDEARAALTASQIPHLNVVNTRIHRLTPQQINWLTITQIRSLPPMDFEYLTPAQIPYLKPAQVYAISTSSGMNNWTAEARAALTYDQVRLLNTTDFRINRLTSGQISWLRTSQIETVQFTDFLFLHSWQVPKLTAQQFSTITGVGTLRGLPDESRAQISNAQLLALPFDVLSEYILSQAPTNYHPAIHMPIGPDGIPISAHLTEEANRVFALVPVASATHVAIRDGDWTDPNVWQNGVVPTAGAKVHIGAGRTVRFNAFMNTAIDWLRVDGKLEFAVDQNTQLKVDTVVITTSGALHIGTATNPLRSNVTAKILIPDNGPINTVRDPFLLSRGVLSRGEVRMFGQAVTSYVSLATGALAGQNQLVLSQVPTNWKVGDRLVIAGVMAKRGDFGTEELQIQSINGAVVTLTAPLQYNHIAPEEFGLSVHVSNMSRNIVIEAEDASVIAERPHMMFFHNPNVQIENIRVSGLGRTDKSQYINDPVVFNGVLQPGTGTNARARYAVHFHHTSVNPALAPATVKGVVVDGSPGWGYVNHSSNVIFDSNVAYNVVGSSFVTEDGNEIGEFRNNLAINTLGVPGEAIDGRPNHDFGFRGNGFWLQGPGVKLTNNISTGSMSSGFVLFSNTSKNMFDAVNLSDPAMALGHDAIPVGIIPWAGFTGNTAYTARAGLEIWNHLFETNDNQTYIDDFSAWNVRTTGIDIHYSGQITVRNARLLNDMNEPVGNGVTVNDFVHDVTLQNLTALGFVLGVEATLRGDTIIDGATIAAATGVYIGKGINTTRRVQILGDVAFATLSAAQLQGATQYDIYASSEYDPEDFMGYDLATLMDEDELTVAINGTTPYSLSYYAQLDSYVPFPSGEMSGYVPDVYLNKTNRQLQDQYGVSFGGEMLTFGDVTQLPRVYGLARYGF